MPVGLAVTGSILVLLVGACGGSRSPGAARSPAASTPPGSSPSTSATPLPSAPVPATPSPTPSPSATTPAPAPSPTTPPTGLETAPAALFGRIITRLPTERRVVALTFDAGANADGVAAILSTLRSQHVPATFFLTGRFVTAYPTLAEQMARSGVVGNHTVDHPHLPTLSDARVDAEVTDAALTITRTTGRSPRPWFRFPFGDSSARTLQRVNALGYVAVGWTVDSLGWEGSAGGVSAATVTARVLAARAPGEIVLMHVGSNPDDHTTFDAQALPRIIAGLRADGYGFVSLDALSGP